MIWIQPEFMPDSTRLSSLNESSPFSCSHRSPDSGSNAIPNELRMPYSACRIEPSSPGCSVTTWKPIAFSHWIAAGASPVAEVGEHRGHAPLLGVRMG
jgi:hypothetical protein